MPLENTAPRFGLHRNGAAKLTQYLFAIRDKSDLQAMRELPG
jgi:hypothetical protein